MGFDVQNGVNFLIHLDDSDLNIVTSQYSLGFLGVGSVLQPGEWNETTYLVSNAAEQPEIQCKNIKYAADGSAYLRGMTDPLALVDIPNYESTLNIRFKNPSDVTVPVARLRFYDREKTVDDPPQGLDIKVAEIVHSSYLQSGASGRGSKTWKSAGNGEWVTLSRSPGPSGITAGGYGYSDEDTHDWYLALSVSPKVLGSRTSVGMQVYLEYL